MDEMEGEKNKWKTPEEVMRFHRLKKRLSNRMSCSQPPPTFSSNSTNSEDSLMEFPVVAKRKFPFPFAERNTRRAEDTDESGVETDQSSLSGERTLFNLLDRTHINSPNTPTSFSNIINHLSPKPVATHRSSKPISPEAASPSSCLREELKKKIPIDWSLKFKLRLMSTRPFAWNSSMRTTEHVSAITGFARCLEPGRNRQGGTDLDMSSNSQFHRCCLFWQHPHLPWIPLFSKSSVKLSATLVSAQLQIAETLHAEFVIAFKSLLQLLRTQQCPYFYIIGTQFHCLFRAAGMAGQSEANALISPTTRGFRKLLEDEDIAYTMPLRKRKRQHSGSSQDSDSTLKSSQPLGDDSDEDVDASEWTDSAQIRKITNAQKAKELRRESNYDECGDSMVLVSGADLQGLFNLLVNCKNNMDRLPPTLVAPTAFQQATLRSCQVRDAVVQVDGVQLHSIQVEGPIMPHALYQMCLLLDDANIEYSAAIATVKQTRPFTAFNASQEEGAKAQSMVFLKEYLSDCGLSAGVMSRLCESDPAQFGVIDGIEPHQCM